MLTFRFDGRSLEVASVAMAVECWTQHRESSGGGVSEIGNGGTVRRGRILVARVAYNGRVTEVG